MNRWKEHKMGTCAAVVILLFVIAGVYAPFLATSKPLVVVWNGQWYFPLFRYLFFPQYFTKNIDIFFNLMMLLLPFFLGVFWIFRKRKNVGKVIGAVFIAVQLLLFSFLVLFPPSDPAVDVQLTQQRLQVKNGARDWVIQLRYMNDYARLNLLLRERSLYSYHQSVSRYIENPQTLWQRNRERQSEEKQYWIEEELKNLSLVVDPLIRTFHWEDDVGGDQRMNQALPWWELTRINRKDLVAALIFGIRISLMVGFLAVGLALAFGIPIGAFSGYYGGKVDIIACRLIEIWESMPTFFMLLLITAMTQSKSIFLVIVVVGVFGWTSFSRYIRGECLKQRNLPYVEACLSLGFNDRRIIFGHLLPNALPPVLTLLPFAIMGAISSEAGLSFLGLGEEGTCSWGVLMDEGRSAFPAESALLWPPAFMLTTLLVAIALFGDTLRDLLDPRQRI